MADNAPDTSSARPLTDAERLVQEAMAEAQASLDKIKDEAVAEEPAAAATAVAEGQAAPMPDFGQPQGSPASATSIELLGDVDLHVTVELGRTQMLVEDVLKLGQGSVVELDKLAGDPVDVYVNNRLIARGEVLVLNDNFCIRISEIVADLEEQTQAAREEVQSSQ